MISGSPKCEHSHHGSKPLHERPHFCICFLNTFIKPFEVIRSFSYWSFHALVLEKSQNDLKQCEAFLCIFLFHNHFIIVQSTKWYLKRLFRIHLSLGKTELPFFVFVCSVSRKKVIVRLTEKSALWQLWSIKNKLACFRYNDLL